jgi:hypothetical protein
MLYSNEPLATVKYIYLKCLRFVNFSYFSPLTHAITVIAPMQGQGGRPDTWQWPDVDKPLWFDTRHTCWPLPTGVWRKCSSCKLYCCRCYTLCTRFPQCLCNARRTHCGKDICSAIIVTVFPLFLFFMFCACTCSVLMQPLTLNTVLLCQQGWCIMGDSMCHHDITTTPIQAAALLTH